MPKATGMQYSVNGEDAVNAGTKGLFVLVSVRESEATPTDTEFLNFSWKIKLLQKIILPYCSNTYLYLLVYTPNDISSL